jgi:hypothetical protein
MRLGLKFEVAAIGFGEGVDFTDQKMIQLGRIGLARSDKSFEAQTRLFL